MTDHPTRRDFLGLSAAGVAGLLTPSWPNSARAESVPVESQRAETDLVVYNAKVYTMDPALPRAEAFAVKSGRITAVGSTAGIRSLAAKGVATLDAKGMTIVP